MRDLYLDSNQIIKQEQYKDLIREADHYRLIKAVAEAEAEDIQNVARTWPRVVSGLARRLASLMPLGPAQTYNREAHSN
jgi:predicted transcriptional regulator